MKGIFLRYQWGRDCAGQCHVILVGKEKGGFTGGLPFLLGRFLPGPGQSWFLAFLQLLEFLVQVVVTCHQGVVSENFNMMQELI